MTSHGSIWPRIKLRRTAGVPPFLPLEGPWRLCDGSIVSTQVDALNRSADPSVALHMPPTDQPPQRGAGHHTTVSETSLTLSPKHRRPNPDQRSSALLSAAAFGFGIFALTACATTTSSSSARSEQKACRRESTTRSTGDSARGDIRFTNGSKAPIDVFWLDYDGKRVLYGSLEPGQSLAQQSYVTHPWVISDKSGKCLSLIIVTSDSRDVSIR